MKTVREKIRNYLSSNEDSKTYHEIAEGIGGCYNTVRREMNDMYSDDMIKYGKDRVCTVCNRTVQTWAIKARFRKVA